MKKNVLAKDLAHGEKRKLELAMLLALKRMCYYLMSRRQVFRLRSPAILQVIENIKKHPESTIVLIEHKMDMILGLSDHLIVLFHGELLAEGLPEEIMKDERVQSAYLGDYIVALLQVNNIETYLDQFHILQGVSLAVEKGRLLYCLVEMGQGKQRHYVQ